MSSNNVVDEFVVKVKLESDDYDKGVGKLTESNDKLQEKLSRTEESAKKVSDSAGQLGESFAQTGSKTEELAEKSDKLAEGLEDTEKQMQKTGKSTRENARDIKNTTDEFQKLSTGIGTAISLMAKFTGAMVAGTGFAKLTTDISKAGVQLDNLAKKSNTTYKTMKTWEYAGGELGGDGQAMTQAIYKISRGVEAFKTSGDQSLLRFFNLMKVPFLDEATGEVLPITQLLMGLTREFARRENKANLNYVLEEHGLGELFEPLVLNSPERVQEVLNRQQNKFIASDSDIGNMREFENNMQEIWNHFDSLNTLFVTNMLPTLLKVQEAIKGVLEYFQDNPEQAELAGAIGAGAGALGTAWIGKRVFGKIFGSGGGKGGIAGGVLTDHVQKVFVVNMGQGGFDPKSQAGSKAMPIATSVLGTVGVAVVAGYADHSPKSEVQIKREQEEEMPYIESFKQKYGVEGIREAYKAQGPWGWHTDNSWQSSDPTSLTRYLKQYEELMAIASEYGEDTVSSVYSKNKGYFSSSDWKSANPEDLRKWIEAEVKSQSGEGTGLAVGGIGSVVNRELKDGNRLAQEANSWLKQIYTNPTVKNIENILERVFPKNANEVELAWGGKIGQPSASSAFSYSGSNTVRDEDYDGSGVSPHTGMDGASIMEMLNQQNRGEDSLQARQEAGLEYFMSKGFTREQAIGLVANFTRESGLNPGALNPNEIAQGKRFSSKGIAQWNRGRLDNFKDVIGKDITESTLQEQFAFVLWELENTHKVAGNKLRRATTADEATQVVTQHYEVPANMNDEIRKRQEIARDLVGTGFSPADMFMNNLNMPQQQLASNTSTVDVSIGNITVHTTAQTLTGVGEDMAEAMKARMMLGQLTTGAV